MCFDLPSDDADPPEGSPSEVWLHPMNIPGEGKPKTGECTEPKDGSGSKLETGNRTLQGCHATFPTMKSKRAFIGFVTFLALISAVNPLAQSAGDQGAETVAALNR